MRRTIALMILVSFLLAPLGWVHTQVEAANELPWGFVDGIKLVTDDTLIFGNYRIVVKDIDSVSWSKAIIEVSGPEGTKEITVTENSYAYYPDDDKPVLRFSVILWNSEGTPTIFLTVSSPLVKKFTKVIPKGGTITVTPGNVEITLVKSNSTAAEFKAKSPTTPAVTFTLTPGEGWGINYKLANSTYTYSNFVYVYLNKTTSSSATVDVYMPKVPVTKIEVIRAKEESGSSSQTTQGTCSCMVYDDLLYAGEKLSLRYDKTLYGIEVVSVSSTKVSVKVYEGSKLLNTYLLPLGQTQKISGTPISFLITRADVRYGRVEMKVYAPRDTQVIPPVRKAVIKVGMTALPKKVLLGDYLVVTISVENDGRGDAYDLNVAAPIPNGFQLVSSTQSWSLKTLPAFSKMPALIYVLKPTKVGKFQIGRALVKYYDDQSLLTGAQRAVYSPILSGIEVYAVPKLSLRAKAYNGTWGSYVRAKVNDTVTLALTLNAEKGNPTYEFIKNATLILRYPKSLKGPTVLSLGTVKAGDVKTVKVPLQVLGENLSLVEATLRYLDPLGNQHEVNYGTLVAIDSVPPKVVVEKVKVWPKPEELPAYINRTLASMDNATPLAEEIMTVVSPYVPKKSNPWKPIAIVFIVATLVLAGVLYNCRRRLGALEAKVLRKQRRPGGLPKKAEEDEVEMI